MEIVSIRSDRKLGFDVIIVNKLMDVVYVMKLCIGFIIRLNR